MIFYLTKMIICSAVLLLIYKFLFDKEKMYQFNRFYLLISLIMPLIIPELSFDFPKLSREGGYYVSEVGKFANIKIDSGSHMATNLESNFYSSALYVYFLFVIFLVIRFFSNLYKIITLINNSTVIKEQGYNIVLLEKCIPFSFLNNIFLEKGQYYKNKIDEEIIIHELVHVNQKHSYDILFAEFLHQVIWFNPVIYFYKKEIRLNHEFIADDEVIQKTQNLKKYQYLILNESVSNNTCVLTSQFNYLLTKKRFMMMKKKRSFRSNIWKQVASIPMVAFVFFVFSKNALCQNPNEKGVNASLSVTSTIDGVNLAKLNEFKVISQKYVEAYENKKFVQPTQEEMTKMQEIYFAMSKKQQNEQKVGFIPFPDNLPKKVPTPSQFTSWKNQGEFGVWIDGKKVKNSSLNDYDHSDFVHFFQSKLARNAAHYGKYTYHLELYTADYYAKTLGKSLQGIDKYLMAFKQS